MSGCSVRVSVPSLIPDWACDSRAADPTVLAARNTLPPHVFLTSRLAQLGQYHHHHLHIGANVTPPLLRSARNRNKLRPGVLSPVREDPGHALSAPSLLPMQHSSRAAPERTASQLQRSASPGEPSGDSSRKQQGREEEEAAAG